MEIATSFIYIDWETWNYWPHNLQTRTSDQFKNLPTSRFLQLSQAALRGDFNGLFSELRWLQWFYAHPMVSFSAINLHLPELVVLELSHNQFTASWEGWNSIEAAKRLKVLDLSHSMHLRCTPDLSAFVELECLILYECRELKQVHPSIGKVRSLVSLDLRYCVGLWDLPEEVGELEQLKELVLDDAGIRNIPSSIGSLKKLEKLSASNCRSLRKIPNSIGNLSSLQHLDLHYCFSLSEVPSSIGDLQSLQHLDISRSVIEKLPTAIGRLKKLQRLILTCCTSLKGEIPSEIGSLCSLENLEITFAPISSLPESIRNLSSLKRLDLMGCFELQSLPELPSGLTYLAISCQSLRLPQLSSLIHIEELSIHGCDLQDECITELPSRLLKLHFESCRTLMLHKLEESRFVGM
ncbi:disease resistance protein TAO1-like [Rhodamnia argentea]|uniref:Disease resistance protein TAO1-like n=1 Tax=Rhodamnia argentea TaxID=178133 RepID=A0ABM3HJ89_9MYRT|nr:disease resistance protein TAO1-like [Rhodamnia argentea]